MVRVYLPEKKELLFLSRELGLTIDTNRYSYIPAGTTKIVQDKNKTTGEYIYISDSLTCPGQFWGDLGGR